MGVQEHRTKVINNSLNPKWNASMQFTIKDLHEDVLCITVYDRDLFTPNGQSPIKYKNICLLSVMCDVTFLVRNEHEFLVSQFLVSNINKQQPIFLIELLFYIDADFLGRTEVRIKDIVKETREKKGPITKRLVLHEVDSGEVVVKLDLQIYDST